MDLQFDTRQRWILTLTALASFMTALDAMVVTTALTTIRDDLGASLGTLQWTVNAYNLSFSVLLMTGAALGERFGRKRILIAGLLLFSIASGVCGLSHSVQWLIAGRILQGIGSALVAPVSMSILSSAFPGPQRAAALGTFASVTGIALIAGPALGGAVTQGLSWQWIFWLNIPVGAALIALIIRQIDESHGDAIEIDFRGALFLSLSALGLAWALVRGHNVGWSSAEVIAAVILAIGFGVAFIAVSNRSKFPMIPPRLFAVAGFRAALSAGALMYATLYGMLFLLPQLLQSQSASVLQAGLKLLPWTATLFVIAPIAGKAVARVGERRIATIGLILQGCGIGTVGWLSYQGFGYLALVPALIAAGAGVSMAMPAIQSVAMSSVTPQDIGKASGVFNSVRFFAGFCGISIITEVFSRAGSFSSLTDIRTGTLTAMLVIAAISLSGVIFASQMPNRR